MGQTLTHGVYLPDEGERNCYSGLAANWSILDNSVGTVAEHTTALSGKAPLVHTHGKADITDLFNSANTWTENNIFSNFITSKESAAIPAGGYGKGIAFRDYQNNRLGYIQPFLTSNNKTRLLIGADSGDIASNSNIIPNANNSVNLGTSTNKWKSINGVNPGALSLPKEEYADVDISTQGLNWDLTGSSDNSYTPNRDGWLEIWAKRTSLPTAYISVGNAYVRQVSEATVFNFACVTCPVRNGQTYTVRILADECHVRIMKAEGNV